MYLYPILLYWGVELFAILAGLILIAIVKCYPKILEKNWRIECHEFLDLPPETQNNQSYFAILTSCDRCQKKIPLKMVMNSFCPSCQTRDRWPWLLMVMVMVSTLAIYIHFGLVWKSLALGIFAYGLILLAFIDYREEYLPDDITLGLLWLGLILNASNMLFTNAIDAIYGAAVPYIALWLLTQITSLVLKRRGIGLGDFKMIALVGAWVGVSHIFLPVILALGLQFIFIIAINFIKFKFVNLLDTRLQFGPALALAALFIIFNIQ